MPPTCHWVIFFFLCPFPLEGQNLCHFSPVSSSGPRANILTSWEQKWRELSVCTPGSSRRHWDVTLTGPLRRLEAGALLSLRRPWEHLLRPNLPPSYQALRRVMPPPDWASCTVTGYLTRVAPAQYTNLAVPTVKTRKNFLPNHCYLWLCDSCLSKATFIWPSSTLERDQTAKD